MRSFYSIAILCLLGACSSLQRFNKDKARFDNSTVVKSFKSVTDGNDCYFVIRENNFFEFYRQLFDSVKNTFYPGKYTKDGDILKLDFYDKKGEKILGKKALINEEKKEIIFFDHSPAINKKFVFN
ncbi:MAG: hypothetical protein JSS85_04810 [Bacteroidetes bacterium]|nr:hypothetical protein [Bacteroidota bacterium]